MVYFHMNGCGHCKKFNPVWKTFTQFAGKNNIKVDKIEAGTQKDLQKSLGIKGYPTILELDSNNNKVSEFTGDRTIPALKTFCQVKK
jgi:thiol-disulfide isomerase/thioredoxin